MYRVDFENLTHGVHGICTLYTWPQLVLNSNLNANNMRVQVDSLCWDQRTCRHLRRGGHLLHRYPLVEQKHAPATKAHAPYPCYG